MNIFVFGNRSNVTAALGQLAEDSRDSLRHTLRFCIIDLDEAAPANVPTLTADCLSYLETADAILVWGTWGSSHLKRQWNVGGPYYRNGLKDRLNQFAERLARSYKIPLLVAETATLSRLRTNYIDVPSFKSITPYYYRLGVGHWTYDRTLWCNPTLTDYSRLDQFRDRLNQKYDLDWDYRSHVWQNTRRPRRKIWLLPGLEQDPTSTMPIMKWIKESITTIKRVSSRQIVIKPHPLSVLDFKAVADKFSKVSVANIDLPIKDCYSEMYCAVIDNSTSIFELFDAGIPTFTNKYNFGSPLGNTDLSKINDIYYPSTEQTVKWLHQMSYTEFSIDEWRSTDMFQYIHHLIERGNYDISTSTR